MPKTLGRARNVATGAESSSGHSDRIEVRTSLGPGGSSIIEQAGQSLGAGRASTLESSALEQGCGARPNCGIGHAAAAPDATGGSSGVRWR